MNAAATMTRLPNWQLRLEAFVAERQHMPFAWGTNDCCMFAAGAVQALTGHDVAARLRGSYSTGQQALRRLRTRGGVSAIASKVLGPSIRPLQAGIGDVVLLSIEGQDALGLCNGTTVLGPGPAGLVAYGMDVAIAAWRVG